MKKSKTKYEKFKESLVKAKKGAIKFGKAAQKEIKLIGEASTKVSERLSKSGDVIGKQFTPKTGVYPTPRLVDERQPTKQRKQYREYDDYVDLRKEKKVKEKDKILKLGFGGF